MTSRRLMLLLAVLLGFALLAAACGGTDVVAPTEPPNPTSEPDPPTTTESTALTPDEIVDNVAITGADLPTSYSVEIDDEDDPPCDGRDDVETLFPTDAQRATSITGDHVFNTVVTVHLEESAAIDAFAYNVESLTVCNGALRTDPEGVVRFDIEPADVQVVGDVDESGSAFYRGTDADATAEFLMMYARRGNVTVVTFGSETPTTIYLQELMLSRLTDTTPPDRVEPQGEIEVGPGDPALAPSTTEPSTTEPSTTEPGTTEPPPTTAPSEAADVAGDVRDLADQILEDDPLQFIENSADAELNGLTARTCAKLVGADPDNTTLVNRLFAELWEESDPSVRDLLEPFDFGQVLGVMMGVGCPETLELLG